MTPTPVLQWEWRWWDQTLPMRTPLNSSTLRLWRQVAADGDPEAMETLFQISDGGAGLRCTAGYSQAGEIAWIRRYGHRRGMMISRGGLQHLAIHLLREIRGGR